MRIGVLPACRGGQPVLLRRRDAFKMIAASACCASARGQKHCKPAQHTRQSLEKWQSQRRTAPARGHAVWIDMGLTKAGDFRGTNAQGERLAVGKSA